jgi:glycosyltransferase involved in cell wall biosynthesis
MVNHFPNVVVCLPAYNEVESIERMIDGIRKENFEVIVTDGGSTDGTKEKTLAKGVPLLERPGKGKGYGMRQAIHYASEKGYEIIVFLDCDMTYPIERIKDLIAEMGDADMVVGARNYNMMPLVYKLVNLFFTSLVNMLNSGNYKDTQSGMRAMRVDKFLDFITVEGIEVEIEISSKAMQKNYLTRELLIDYYQRVGKSKIHFWHAFSITYRIIVCRFSHSNKNGT